jgi:hypothetical protein
MQLENITIPKSGANRPAEFHPYKQPARESSHQGRLFFLASANAAQLRLAILRAVAGLGETDALQLRTVADNLHSLVSVLERKARTL